MFKNANKYLLIVSILVTAVMVSIGKPKSTLNHPKGLPILAIAEIGELESVTYTGGQTLVVAKPGEGDYSPQLFSAQDTEKPENLGKLVKIAKAVVNLKAEVSEAESSESIKVIRNLKAYSKDPKKSRFFAINSEGKLFYGVGENNEKSQLVATLSPKYFQDKLLINKLSRAKNLAKIKDGKLNVDTDALAVLAFDRVYVAFYPLSNKEGETEKAKVYPKVTELVLKKEATQVRAAAQVGQSPSSESTSSTGVMPSVASSSGSSVSNKSSGSESSTATPCIDQPAQTIHYFPSSPGDNLPYAPGASLRCKCKVPLVPPSDPIPTVDNNSTPENVCIGVCGASGGTAYCTHNLEVNPSGNVFLNDAINAESGKNFPYPPKCCPPKVPQFSCNIYPTDSYPPEGQKKVYCKAAIKRECVLPELWDKNGKCKPR